MNHSNENLKQLARFALRRAKSHIALFRSSAWPKSAPISGKLSKFLGSFWKKEFFRYFISGSIAFVVDISVLVFCTEVLGLHYLYSNIASYVVGLLVSYTINIKWVFKHRRFYSRKRKEFAYFTFIASFGLVTSELVLWLLTESIEIHYTWGESFDVFCVSFQLHLKKMAIVFSR